MGAGKPKDAGAGGTVVLGMVLHCAGCAKKVRKSIHHMPGVVSVVADPATNTVLVAGTADAAALKARIEDKTKKTVQILAAGTGAKPPSPADKQGGEEKKSPADKQGDNGDKAGAAQSPPQTKEEETKKQPPAIEEPTTALLRIRLHCDSCADRIRRRIHKIKGVKDVVLDGSAKDEVKVVGTMDVPAMVAYLNDKLNRAVDLAPAPAPAPGGDDGFKKDSQGGKKKDESDMEGKGKGVVGPSVASGKGVEVVVGPSVASAAASLAPAPAGSSTHHVSPYGYGHVAYPPQQQPGYYQQQQQQPSADAGSYYQQQPAGGYYQQQQPSSEYAGGYSYQQQQPSSDAGGYYQQQQQPRGEYYEQPYPSSYGFDAAPSAQMFNDEDPNAACSLM